RASTRDRVTAWLCRYRNDLDQDSRHVGAQIGDRDRSDQALVAAIQLRQPQETVRRDTHLDMIGANAPLHRPATDERAPPDLAKFEHAKTCFMGVESGGQKYRRQDKQGRPERSHCSYRTV